MKFEPKTEAEVKQASEVIWDGGFYDFEIMNGVDKKSKSSGADMIELRIKLFNGQGEEKIVYDYLLESIMYKLLHAAEACGLMEKYKSGELVGGDFEGCTGRLKLGVGKPQGEYPAKNEVKDYFVPTAETEAAPKPKKVASAADKLDDSIPF